MKKAWNEFWNLVSIVLTGSNGIATNVVEGTVSISAAYREAGGYIEDAAKDLRQMARLAE